MLYDTCLSFMNIYYAIVVDTGLFDKISTVMAMLVTLSSLYKFAWQFVHLLSQRRQLMSAHVKVRDKHIVKVIYLFCAT